MAFALHLNLFCVVLATFFPIRPDPLGDSLPYGAWTRLGTNRFRHNGPINRVQYLADGRRVLSFGWDHVLRLWDASTGKQLRQIRGSEPLQCHAYALSPDEKQLAVLWFDMAQERSLIEVMDFATGTRGARWSIDKTDYVNHLLFAPDGQTLLGTRRHKEVDSLLVWDIATGRLLRTLEGRAAYPLALALQRQGKYAAVGWNDGKVSLFDMTTGRREELTGHPEGMRCVAFSPDGRLLASGGASPDVLVWDVTTRKVVHRLTGSNCTVMAVQFSPDGNQLATSGNASPQEREVTALMEVPQQIDLWELPSGKHQRSILAQAGWVSSLAFSPDGQMLASTGREASVRLWEVASGKEHLPLPGHQDGVCCMAFSPDGRLLATAGRDHLIRLWDTKTWQSQGSLPGHKSYIIMSLAFSPDGTLLASGDGAGGVILWEVASRSKVRDVYLKHGKLPIQALSFSGDGKQLVAVPQATAAQVADITTGKVTSTTAEFKGSYGMVACLGAPLFATCGHQSINVLDLRNERRHILPAPRCRCLAFSPDGRLLAAGGETNLLHVWEPLTGRRVLVAENGATSHALAFAPEGRTIFVALEQGDAMQLRAVEILSGKARWTWSGGHDINVLAVSPDGKWIVSGSQDSTILVWPGPFAGRPQDSKPVTQAELHTLWNVLAGENAATAYQAQQRLLAEPVAVVAFLRKHLQPVRAIDPKQLHQAMRDLDASSFAERQRAAQTLLEMGEQALPHLREVPPFPVSPEVQRRLAEIAEQMEQQRPATLLQQVRAVELLELLATSEAHQLLTILAQGAPAARVTQEAQAAQKRAKSK
jgi:WD40 repeat protein